MTRKRFYADSETIGFVGPIVLIQYAIGRHGKIIIHEFWKKSVRETIELIESMMHHHVVAFNMTFDWFHFVKAYNCLKAYERNFGGDKPPDKDLYWLIDSKNPSNYCLKPIKSLDLMLWCQRGPYQYVMDRKDIYVRKIPTLLAPELRDILERSIFLESALNAEWKVENVLLKSGEVDPRFSNVVLRFRPSRSLDAVSKDALGVGKAPSFFKTLPKVEETKWRPYGGNWNRDDIFEGHTNFWHNNPEGRFYAERDVELLQRLDEKFEYPDESVDDRLAILVANTRWRGFGVDVKAVEEVISSNLNKMSTFPININSSKQVVEYLKEGLPAIKAAVIDSSSKVVLEKLSKQGYERAQDVLTTRMAGSRVSLFKKFVGGIFHASMKVIGALSGRMSGADGLNPHGIPREIRAPFIMKFTLEMVKHILNNLSVTLVDKKELNDLIDKLIKAQDKIAKKHKSKITNKVLKAVEVLEAKIKRLKHLVELEEIKLDPTDFNKLLDPVTMEEFEEVLSGGDFAGFEVSIADAVYDDKALRALLESGKKVHGLFGEEMTGKSYDEILLTKEGKCAKCAGSGTLSSLEVSDSREGDYEAEQVDYANRGDKCDSCKGTGVDNTYTDCKSGFFAYIFGAEARKEAQTLKIPVEQAQVGLTRLEQTYVGIGKAKKATFDKFCSMRQPEEGGAVYWSEPAEYEETLLGFKRYFTLENRICKALFNLAQNPPKEWRGIETKFERRQGRIQTASGCVQSALFGAAFGIQSQAMRAAGNHRIQGTGAQLNKLLQDLLWEMQEVGIRGWHTRPMNIHDEIQAVMRRLLVSKASAKVVEFVKRYRSLVPLLAMEWVEDSPNWAGSH